jgi:hypothetical protein
MFPAMPTTARVLLCLFLYVVPAKTDLGGMLVHDPRWDPSHREFLAGEGGRRGLITEREMR